MYSQDRIITYPAPDSAVLNADYSTCVRISGKDWTNIPNYLVKVDEVVNVNHQEKNVSMSYFDFSGEAEVSIKYNRGKIKSARIRPLSLGIEPVIRGNTITFKLTRPCNISIEVNGDIFQNLHLFSNPIYSSVPAKSDTNVIYFGPGRHFIKDNILRVPSGKTVFLEGGAILMGKILFENVENAKLIGHGIIDQSMHPGIRIIHSRNIEVDGVFCAQCFTGGSEGVVIRNVKSMSYYKWGDGMNVISSKNVLFDGVFIRSSDDCTTVYGTRGEFTGGCSHITMQNSILWADVAHPILVGTHGNTNHPEYLEDLKYVNIDILDHNEAQIDYQGCMSLNAGDSNFIRNVLFDDIRVEDFRRGQLLNLRVFYNLKYCTSPGRGIENVTFRNVSYHGKNAEMSVIAGYDDTRKVKNIVFENLRINGILITDTMKGKPGWYKTGDMARFFIGEHVAGIKFR